jgi:hypothetical protein
MSMMALVPLRRTKASRCVVSRRVFCSPYVAQLMRSARGLAHRDHVTACWSPAHKYDGCLT